MPEPRPPDNVPEKPPWPEVIPQPDKPRPPETRPPKPEPEIRPPPQVPPGPIPGITNEV